MLENIRPKRIILMKGRKLRVGGGTLSQLGNALFALQITFNSLS